MTDKDYMELILSGYMNHKNYLGDFLYRESKAAAEKHIKVTEFFGRLGSALRFLLGDVEKSYNERVAELSIIKGLWKKEGRPLEELIGQLPNLSDYSVHLLSLSGGRYIGHLWMYDLHLIHEAIAAAIEMASADLKANTANGQSPEVKAAQRLLEAFNLLQFFLVLTAPEKGFNWIDAAGNTTTEESKMVRKEAVTIPRQRQAKNESDFQLIFERELHKAELENTVEASLFLAPLLIEQTQTYIAQHKAGSKGESWNKPLLFTAKQFTEWLNKKVTTRKNSEKTSTSFASLFNSTGQHEAIMSLLVQHNYCQEKTYIWKDKRKGNKAVLSSIIKYLHTQRYYRSGKPPTNAEIKDIALHTFGMQLAIDTVKKADPDKLDLSFIPAAPLATMGIK